MVNKRKYKGRFRYYSWMGGFLTAVLLFFIFTLWMASAVYSEMPTKATLSDDYEIADAIVCLTGGRGRIRTAFDLFDKGYGRILYISGIDQQTRSSEILNELKKIGPIDETKIVLESVATNTIENAKEVERYIREHDLHKILLVTSSYHVRRSFYIFKKVLPSYVQIDVSWYALEPFDENDWWKTWNGIWVTVSEYFKFLHAYLVLR